MRTVWMFLRYPDGDIRAFPYARFKRIWHRQEPFPEFAGREACFVEVVVELTQRHAERALSVNWGKYRIQADGLLDQWYALQGAVQAMNAREARGKDPFTEAVIPVNALLAEILYQEGHKWSPTVADLEGLCAAVNARAKRALLTRDGMRLVVL